MSHNLKWWQCQETSRSISLNYVKNGHGETFHFLIALPSTPMASCYLTMVERICGISFCLLPSYDCLILWLTPTLWLTKMSKFSLLLAIFPKWRRGPDVMFKALQWLLFLGSALARQVWSVVFCPLTWCQVSAMCSYWPRQNEGTSRGGLLSVLSRKSKRKTIINKRSSH